MQAEGVTCSPTDPQPYTPTDLQPYRSAALQPKGKGCAAVVPRSCP